MLSFERSSGRDAPWRVCTGSSGFRLIPPSKVIDLLDAQQLKHKVVLQAI
jgi:hypothetical protein